jgi:hypothetical protein
MSSIVNSEVVDTETNNINSTSDVLASEEDAKGSASEFYNSDDNSRMENNDVESVASISSQNRTGVGNKLDADIRSVQREILPKLEGRTVTAAMKQSLVRLEKCIEVRKHCRERQHFLRCSKLALMHERNTFLRKLRIIEELGRRNNWHIRKNNGNELLSQVYKVLNRS